MLAIPAALTLLSLIVTWRTFPHPGELETVSPPPLHEHATFPSSFWWYLAAMSLVAIGYADWPLIALHVSRHHLVSADLAPVLYAVAMAAEAVAALMLGKLFDRVGLLAVFAVTVLTAAYAPLVFLGGLPLVVAGALVWGPRMAAQESVIKAVITAIVRPIAVPRPTTVRHRLRHRLVRWQHPARSALRHFADRTRDRVRSGTGRRATADRPHPSPRRTRPGTPRSPVPRSA